MTYTIERSSDLVTWVAQGTLLATGATTIYTSAPLSVGEPQYFYRATK